MVKVDQKNAMAMMNELSAQAKPFVFFIDFDQEQIIISEDPTRVYRSSYQSGEGTLTSEQRDHRSAHRTAQRTSWRYLVSDATRRKYHWCP